MVGHGSLRVAILEVAQTSIADGAKGVALASALDGSSVVAISRVGADDTRVRSAIAPWLADREIDLVIIVDGSGVAARALGALDLDTLDEPDTRWRALVGERARAFVPVLAALGGSKLVLVAHAAVTIDRAAPRMPPPIPMAAMRPRHLTTGTIATIGDLGRVPAVDLRTGGRRALWALAMTGLAVVGILGAAAVTIARNNDALLTTHPAATPQSSPPMTGSPPPPPSAAPMRSITTTASVRPVKVGASRPPSNAVATTKAPRVPRKPTAETPPLHAPEPAPTAATDDDNDDACSQASCAAHDNERECCAPYRGLPAKLDRSMIANATASTRSRALACGLPPESAQLVRVAVEVDPSGDVANTVVLEAPDPTVGACVADAISATHFPQTATGGTYVARIDLSKQ